MRYKIFSGESYVYTSFASWLSGFFALIRQTAGAADAEDKPGLIVQTTVNKVLGNLTNTELSEAEKKDRAYRHSRKTN